MSYTRRIDIQTLTETADSIGNRVQSWSTLLSAWASVKRNKGSEYSEAGQINAENTFTFRLRYSRRLAELTTQQLRVVYDGKTFDVKQLCDDRDRRLELVIVAQEVNGGT